MNDSQLLFPVKAAHFIPQQDAMCCIDEIIASTGISISVITTLHPEHILLNQQNVLVRAGFIELAAQSGCALMGLEQKNDIPSTAWLAGVQSLVVHKDAYMHDVLLISVSIVHELAEIRVLDFKIATQHQLLASGSLKVFYTQETGIR